MDSLAIKLIEVKQGLLKNLNEARIIAVRIFNINVKTLEASIKRDSGKKRDEHNKILEKHEEHAIDGFIRSLLIYSIPSIRDIVFHAVVSLKRAHDSDCFISFKVWFRGGWKQSNLHKIKTKSLAMERYDAVTISDVKEWFDRYKDVLRTLKIRRKNVINFDETGVRVGCMRGEEILVSADIKEYYVVSLENRKSISIIEAIDAMSEYSPSLMIIIQGHEIMGSWISEGLPSGTRIVSSDSEFTSDKIAVEYLKHYIQHSDAGSNAEWKLLLMDNHGSHVTSEFIALVNENHIRSFSFIAHLTHCMQSLDVGIFQSYKYWHGKVILEAISQSFIVYDLSHFLNDLTKIRNNTFKKDTIRHAFEKSGMWSINVDKCLKLMKKFNSKDDESRLSLLRTNQSNQAQNLAAMKNALDHHWGLKIARNMQGSDSIREDEFNSFINQSKEVLVNSILRESELIMLQGQRMNELHDKKYARRARKRLRAESGNLGLIKKNAERALTAKFDKERVMEKKRTDAQFMKIGRMKRDDIHAKEIAARKAEKARIKQLKELQKSLDIFISEEMFQFIPDLETEGKATDLTGLAQQEAKKNKEKKSRVEFDSDHESDDLEIIINRSLRSGMEEDFVAFEDSENDNADEENSRNARYAGYARSAGSAGGRSEHAEHDIADEFLSGDFFDGWDDDEGIFSAMCSQFHDLMVMSRNDEKRGPLFISVGRTSSKTASKTRRISSDQRYSNAHAWNFDY